MRRGKTHQRRASNRKNGGGGGGNSVLVESSRPPPGGGGRAPDRPRAAWSGPQRPGQDLEADRRLVVVVDALQIAHVRPGQNRTSTQQIAHVRPGQISHSTHGLISPWSVVQVYPPPLRRPGKQPGFLSPHTPLTILYDTLRTKKRLVTVSSRFCLNAQLSKGLCVPHSA